MLLKHKSLRFKFLLSCLLLLPAGSGIADSAKHPDKAILDVEVRTLNGDRKVNLAKEYKGKVVLIVNTASKCAFTSQYEGLEALYNKYKDKGLVVLGFPSNDFGNQEPGNEKQIQSFCRMTYGVQFPMFAKTRVTKQNADPLYKRLGEISGTYPKWNFYKYLLNRNGQLVETYSSVTGPDSSSLIKEIESLLAEQTS